MGQHDSKPDAPDRPGQFVTLLTAHQRDLYTYINTLLVGDVSAADVLQDTNLDLWKRIEEFDFDRPFLPWAYSFAYQRVLAHRKTRARSRLVFNDHVLQFLSDAYVSDTIAADSRLAALRNCVAKLEHEQRRLIRDRYLGKVSVNALAAKLGGTANQISARLYRIRRSLAKCIEASLAAEGS